MDRCCRRVLHGLRTAQDPVASECSPGARSHEPADDLQARAHTDTTKCPGLGKRSPAQVGTQAPNTTIDDTACDAMRINGAWIL